MQIHCHARCRLKILNQNHNIFLEEMTALSQVNNKLNNSVNRSIDSETLNQTIIASETVQEMIRAAAVNDLQNIALKKQILAD